MKIISGFVALGAGLIAASVAMAAEPPDLVGAWKPTGESYASVRLGDDNDHHPEYPTPSYGEPGDAWSVVIREQKGRAFSGASVSPKGNEERIVGVVSFDGERLIIAADEGGMFGEIIGDKIEFCFQDHEDDRAGVACYIAAKQ